MRRLMRVHAEGATGFSLPAPEDREVSWRGRKVLCISALAHLFISFLCAVMNCTVFWELETVPVTIKEQRSAGTPLGKPLEHLRIKGGERSDSVLRGINFLFII